jgi:hypothetical protein
MNSTLSCFDFNASRKIQILGAMLFSQDSLAKCEYAADKLASSVVDREREPCHKRRRHSWAVASMTDVRSGRDRMKELPKPFPG